MLYIHGHAHTSAPGNTGTYSVGTRYTLGCLYCTDFWVFLSRWNCAVVETHRMMSSSKDWTWAIQSSSITSILQNMPCGFAAAFAMSLQLHDLLSCAVGYRKLEQRWLAFELRSRQFSVENRRLSRRKGSRFRDVQYAICYHNIVSRDSCYLS